MYFNRLKCALLDSNRKNLFLKKIIYGGFCVKIMNIIFIIQLEVRKEHKRHNYIIRIGQKWVFWFMLSPLYANLIN